MPTKSTIELNQERIWILENEDFVFYFLYIFWKNAQILNVTKTKTFVNPASR